MNQAHSDARLGTEPIWKLMLQMGLPGLVAQLINLMYNLVDRMYIGHIPDVGQLALTGVGLTLPALQIISAFSALVGNGGAPLAAIALGKGDRERAERILGNGFVTLIAFSVALTTLFLGVRKPFLYLVGASDATYPYANDYMVIYVLGTLFVQLTLGLNPFITCQGKSRVAMLSIVIGAAINIVLDPVFIFLLDMGVRGAALATVISQAASAAWIVHFLFAPGTSLRIRRDRMKLDLKILLGVMALGVSPFIMNSTESLISIVLSSGLSRYGGDLYVGSLTILQSVMQLIAIPLSGFISGVAPIMSYNFGANRSDRVKATFVRLLGIGFGYSALIALAAMLFPTLFAQIFTSNADLVALVGRVLPIFISGMLIFGIQNVCQTTFMALGQAKRSLIIALLRKVVLLAPLAAILPALTQNVMSIYWAEPISDVTSVIICVSVFLVFAKNGGFHGQPPSANQQEN